MELDDFAESEVALAVAATAAVLSPPVRRVLHRGAVLGMTGLLAAGDVVGAFARGVRRGAVQESSTDEGDTEAA